MNKKMLKGFTLIELMVVMALMAVLAVLVLGAVQLARNTATETIHRSNAKGVQAALEADYARNKSYCAAAATAGRLTCATKYSLAAAYAQLSQTTLDNLGATPSTGACSVVTAPTGTPLAGGYLTRSATNFGLGGGTVVTAAGGYTIMVANAGCAVHTGTGDRIQAGTPPADPTFAQ